MPANTDRALLIGTANGLFRATPANSHFEASLVGLKDCGFIRSPVVVDSSDPSRLYVGATRGGVFMSTDGGSTWRESNKGIIHRDVWCVVQHAGTGTLYAGASPASVYISRDHGESWQECESLGRLPTTKGWTGPQPPHVSRMKWVDVYAGDANLIYGAIEEGWAVRSRDGGESWQQIDTVDHDGHMIAMMRNNPSVVIATTGKGMFRSADGGETWSESNKGLSGRCYTPAHLVLHPKDPAVLLTAVTQVGPGGWAKQDPGTTFCRSGDQGLSWDLLPGGLPHPTPVARSLAVDPSAPETFFAGMLDGSVWMSEDGGESFRSVVEGLPQATSVKVLHR